MVLGGGEVERERDARKFINQNLKSRFQEVG